ncbi:MAG: LysR family transcriptional regulator [Oscillospiraceae bacterium]|jgi:DNA-binding transcriptional LysR family regulator
MNEVQIRCFLTVARYMNFSRASEVLYISQPAISRHIGNLERELGAKLFDRREKPVCFTAAGQAYYDFFSRFTEEFSELKMEYAPGQRSVSSTLSFAINSLWYCNDALSGCISRFESRHPEIRVTMNQYLSTNLASSIAGKDADILIHMTSILQDTPDLQVRQIGCVRNAFFYSFKHPLARHASPELADFAKSRFVYIEDGSASPETLRAGICAKIRSLFPEAQADEDFLYPAPNSDVASSLVDDGICVIMQDEWARLRHRPTIRTFLLERSEESVSIAWRTSQENEAVRMFAKEAEEYFRTRTLRLD